MGRKFVVEEVEGMSIGAQLFWGLAIIAFFVMMAK